MKEAIITLGRIGDILTTIPIAFHRFQQGHGVDFVCCKEYSGLFDGISYCNCVPWDGPYSQPVTAYNHFSKIGYDNVYLGQAYGTRHEKECDSFSEEMWRLIGFHNQWGKLPLVFDRRDSTRESALISTYVKGTKPLLMVSSSGHSSPFPHDKRLAECLKQLEDKYQIVDLNGFRCDRFYDLLGLYEIAECLISTDSAPLHLAQACPQLSVVALVTDVPTQWHGAPARPNHRLRIRYGEFPKRASEIIRFLNGSVKKVRRVFHVWNDYYRQNQQTQFRHDVAKSSWASELSSWENVCVHDSSLSRNSGDVGDPRRTAYLKDVISRAVALAMPQDIIVFTNDDNIMVRGSAAIIEQRVNEFGAIWGARWESHKIDINGRWHNGSGYKHCGADVFAFTKEWWDKYQHEIPDYLLGLECWDLAVRTLINLTGGREVEGLVLHQIHQPPWHSAQYREGPGNIHNRNLCRKFFREHNMPWPKV